MADHVLDALQLLVVLARRPVDALADLDQGVAEGLGVMDRLDRGHAKVSQRPALERIGGRVLPALEVGVIGHHDVGEHRRLARERRGVDDEQRLQRLLPRLDVERAEDRVGHVEHDGVQLVGIALELVQRHLLDHRLGHRPILGAHLVEAGHLLLRLGLGNIVQVVVDLDR